MDQMYPGLWKRTKRIIRQREENRKKNESTSANDNMSMLCIVTNQLSSQPLSVTPEAETLVADANSVGDWAQQWEAVNPLQPYGPQGCLDDWAIKLQAPRAMQKHGAPLKWSASLPHASLLRTHVLHVVSQFSLAYYSNELAFISTFGLTM